MPGSGGALFIHTLSSKILSHIKFFYSIEFEAIDFMLIIWFLILEEFYIFYLQIILFFFYWNNNI